jgi:Na+-transporting methylmalonyl-CoA/oxaloacetate decarboxylase gamma subunit
MLREGVHLMAVGMTTVFSFLALLVIVLEISARVFQSLSHRWPDPAIARTRTNPMPRERGDIEVAVALAVIEAHRRRHR